jgi:16S rRNA (guanine527-N7)-methyltransferase
MPDGVAGLKARILRVLAAFGGPVHPSQVEQLSRWAARVQEWNGKMDLTAATTPDALSDLLVADAAALAASDALEPGQRWTDVGSGAGAPGLGLAVLAPRVHMTLVEPKAKRVAFLRGTIGELELSQVTVERCRSSDLSPGLCDVAISRATMKPEAWLAEGARLSGRAVWVLLADGPAPAGFGWRVDREVRYAWPLTGAPRVALRYVPG